MRPIEAEMERLTLDDILLQTLVTLINLGARKAGLATPPGEEAPKRDLEQTRQAIEGARAMLPLLEARHGERARPASRTRCRSCRWPTCSFPAGRRAAAEEPAPEPPKPGEAGPAQSSGRLWVPGQ